MANPMTHDDVRVPVTPQLPVRIGGGIAAAVGCIALMGWLLAVPRLASLGQGLIPMAPSTAVLFVAYGAVVLFIHRATRNRQLRLLACRSVSAAPAFRLCC